MTFILAPYFPPLCPPSERDQNSLPLWHFAAFDQSTVGVSLLKPLKASQEQQCQPALDEHM